jgi:hypothetical protein
MRRCRAIAAGALLALLLLAPSAQAGFELLPGDAGFEVAATEPDDPAIVVDGDADGGPDSLAGSHPYLLKAQIDLVPGPGAPGEAGVPYSDEDVRNLRLDLPAGLVENPAAVGRCSVARFSTPREPRFGPTLSGEDCPADSQIGILTLRSSVGGGETRSFGLFSLVPQGGSGPLIGASPYGVPVTFARRVDLGEGAYRPALVVRDLPQTFNVSGMEIELWGNPWSPGHDLERGACLNETDPEHGYGTAPILEEEGRLRPPPQIPGMPPEPESTYVPGTCSIGDPFLQANVAHAYLTLPSVCAGPLSYGLALTSWQGSTLSRTTTSHDAEGPLPLEGCTLRSFHTAATVRSLNDRASSPTGLDFDLDVDQSSLTDNTTEKGRLRPGVQAPSQVKEAVVTLPEGVTVNPSVAAGLGVCTAAQLEAETARSDPGSGCPNASVIGDVTVATPLFPEPLRGGLFLAEPYRNPFASLIAIYMVAKLPAAGVVVKVPGEIRPDPASGRLVAVFKDLPQLPYTHFRAHFREGQRSLMATPAGCGDYRGGLDLVPWIDPGAHAHDNFFLTFKAGIGGGPCPPPTSPFAPTALGGSVSRSAGAYTPFHLRLGRGDGEQELTRYSAALPPGLLGRIAGVPFCPEAAIAAAADRSGLEEERDPSCPAASRIGGTVVDYGVGAALTSAAGGLYLAGPYHGAPLSILAVDSALIGPFDLGVVLVRSALQIDPRTAQVTIDSAGSDPIPHIVDGIPLYLRNIYIDVDRPGFTLNPTSCERFSVDSFLSGSGPNFSDPGDDVVAALRSGYQTSDCVSLGFRPRIGLRLKGGTKRGDYPSLKATVTPRAGNANIGKVSVALPPAEFLAQEHLKLICSQSQFQAQRCPPGSVYGRARAVTPLMDEPLEGPVYLRASQNPLPDLVADIRGRGIRIEVVGRIDSVRGGMRATYDVLPDAPVSKFSLTLFGGKRGLLVNSEDACNADPARVRMVGQNNRGAILRPRLQAPACKRGKQKQRQTHGRGRGHR